jgi:ABC-type amino acid transport system permease subunit
VTVAPRSEGKNPMERIVETLASGLGNSIGWMAEHGVLLIIFAALWVAFGVALLWSQGSLDQAWATIRGLPLIVQLVVWLLFLPVMAGLWVWETAWPLVIRVLVILGLAGWNLLIFLPKAAQTATP